MDRVEIGVETTLRRSSGIALGELPEETVLLDIDGEKAVRVNSSGAWLWSRLEQPAAAGELAAGLAEHFGIDGERALEDVLAFARDLTGRGLLETA